MTQDPQCTGSLSPGLPPRVLFCLIVITSSLGFYSAEVFALPLGSLDSAGALIWNPGRSSS